MPFGEARYQVSAKVGDTGAGVPPARLRASPNRGEKTSHFRSRGVGASSKTSRARSVRPKERLPATSRRERRHPRYKLPSYRRAGSATAHRLFGTPLTGVGVRREHIIPYEMSSLRSS